MNQGITAMMSQCSAKRPGSRQEFEIAIICALTLEADMVEMVLDKDWEEEGYTYGKAPGDLNTYTTGIIADKNVVLAYCHTMGSNRAAQAASWLRTSFTGIKLAFVVGVCGVVPFDMEQEEIVLGDCIMSTAMVQFDLGRKGPKGFRTKDGMDGLGRVGIELGSMLTKLKTQTNRLRLSRSLTSHLQVLQREDGRRTRYPGSKEDRLFEPSYIHDHRLDDETCTDCDALTGICGKDCIDLGCQDEYLIPRKRPTDDHNPVVHFGIFGSSNTVLKCGTERDTVAKANKIIAFEMEGSGVWDVYPTVVIKAACDYADSHKNKKWQAYAAAVAAAGLKAFLQRLQLPDERQPSTITISKPPAPKFPSARGHGGDSGSGADREIQEIYPYRDLLQLITSQPETTSNRDMQLTILDYQLKNAAAGSTALSGDHLRDSFDLLTIDGDLQALVYERQRIAKIKNLKLIDQLLNLPKLQDELQTHTGTRLENTCDWIFRTPTYQEWYSMELTPRNAKFLWLYGPAGFGKTILCAHIIKSFQKTCSPFVFYHFSRLHEQSGGVPEDIIRRWIYQIAESGSYGLNLVGACLDQRILHLTDIWAVFHQIVSQLKQCVFILDGLDEYNRPDIDRQEFLKLLKSSLRQTSSMVVLTSREDPDIRKQLTSKNATSSVNEPYLYWHEITKSDTQLDISLFARNIVEQKLAGKDTDLRQDLASRMADRCDGMFLWLDMMGKDLRESQSKTHLKKIADSIPDLRTAYEKNLRSVLHQREYDKVRGSRILQWCVFSVRPLTVSELTEALAIQSLEEPDELNLDDLPESMNDEYIDSEIKKLCGSLVEVKLLEAVDLPAQKIVQLTHLSVKEYLLSSMFSSSEHNPANGNKSMDHLVLAKVCLRYLCCANFPTNQEAGNAFREYAMENWMKHKEMSETDDPSFHNLLAKFLDSGNASFDNWAAAFEKQEWTNESIPYNNDGVPGPLYFAALLGYVPTVEMLLERNASSINSIGGVFGTALQAACAKGHDATIAVLLRSGADVKIKAGEFGSAIGASAYHGRHTLVLDLLKRGARINEQGRRNETPLYSAAMHGHTKIVESLLNENADLAIAHSNGLTPLNVASSNGHLEVVRLLLEKGADTSVKSSSGMTPLYSAAVRGHLKVFQLLLDEGSDIEASNRRRWTPLNTASSNGHLEIVRLLLKKGADISVKSSSGITPLYSAARSGHLEVFQLLLDEGSDIEAPHNNGWTPLNVASSNGHLEIVRLLLKKGADISVKNSSGVTPLLSAAYLGYLEIVRLLLKKGADISVKSSSGMTPLLSAAYSGHLEVFQLLLDEGSDIEALGNNEWTPLNVASINGHLEIVRLLLEKGASLETADKDGWTPLHAASSDDHLEIVRLLLEKGASLETADSQGYTPLNRASDSGHLEVVRLLLEKGASLETADKDGWTPLYAASSDGHLEVARLLLEKGASLETASKDGWTPLIVASSNGHLEVARLLLEKGAGAEQTSDFLFQCRR